MAGAKMPETAKPTVRVSKSFQIAVTVPLCDDKDIREWLFHTKKVAICVDNDYTNHVDKEITIVCFVSDAKANDFYKAVKEWCQEKGYSAQTK